MQAVCTVHTISILRNVTLLSVQGCFKSECINFCTRYREAGAEVIEVLLQFGGIVERASIDEAYIELTSMVDERISAAKT